MSEALSTNALNPRILNQERNSASQSISSFSETLLMSGKPIHFSSATAGIYLSGFIWSYWKAHGGKGLKA